MSTPSRLLGGPGPAGRLAGRWACVLLALGACAPKVPPEDLAAWDWTQVCTPHPCLEQHPGRALACCLRTEGTTSGEVPEAWAGLDPLPERWLTERAAICAAQTHADLFSSHACRVFAKDRRGEPIWSVSAKWTTERDGCVVSSSVLTIYVDIESGDSPGGGELSADGYCPPTP